MKKSTVIGLIVGGSFLLIGLAVFLIGMSLLHWDLSRLSNTQFETNTYSVSEDFADLSISAEEDNITFALSDDGGCKVVCHEQKNYKHTVAVKNNTLTVGATDTREWYERISLFSFESPKLTVYLPKESYTALNIDTQTGDIDLPAGFTFDSISITGSTADVICKSSSKNLTGIKLSTGDIRIADVTSGEFDLSVSTGDITMQSVTCNKKISAKVTTGDLKMKNVTCLMLDSTGSTGDVLLDNTVASGPLSVKRSTGDIKFVGADAASLYVKTDTGDVTGTLLSAKIFSTDTATGSVSVPKSSSGGTCEIITSTGDIDISLMPV